MILPVRGATPRKPSHPSVLHNAAKKMIVYLKNGKINENAMVLVNETQLLTSLLTYLFHRADFFFRS